MRGLFNLLLIHAVLLFHDVANKGCEKWRYNKYIELIDTESTVWRYIFYKGVTYTSCHLESFVSYLNGTTGEWQLFNSSGNVLVMENSTDAFSLQIKVFY